MNCRNSSTSLLRRTSQWCKMALLGAAFALAGGANAQNVNVSGALVGNGTYPTLQAAFAAINSGAQGGTTIAVDIVGNTTETGIAVLNQSASPWASLTVQPSGGAARTITGAITAGSTLVDLNGADNVTINGLNTGGNSLTISNTTVSATSGTSTITLRTDATSNTITNCAILGSSTMAVGTNGGNIFFGAGAVTTGSDNNTISNCDIGPAGANLPTKGIHFGGTGNTDPGTGNSGNVVNNNNIFDYFGAAVTSAGVYVTSGTPSVTISNNRFYQTGTRTQTTGAQHSAVWITNTSGNNYQVTGNTIGYASNTQTGTYTFVGVSSSSVLIPIFLSVGTTTASNASSNTVAGIAMSGAMSGTSSSAAFRGIYVSSGLATCNSNTIGSQSATGSITYTSTSTSASDVIGIFNFGSSAWTTNSNTVGGITVSNSSTGASNLYGIRCNTGSTVTWTCTGNTVGGTVANSMNSTSTATGTIVNGILNNNPIGTFTGNIIRNMTVAGGTGTTSSASMGGFVCTSSANQTVGTNTIFNLSNTNATAATVVTGIQFTGSTANVVERNLIHSLTSSTTSTAAEVNGIRVAGGTTTYRNNMIAIGAGIGNAIGTAASNSNVSGVVGINEALGTNSFFHNSVYIGGTATAGVGASYAFNGVQTTNTRSFRNNIFYNARSNSGATGTHYAVKINGTTVNPTGLTINNNVYFANGTGATFGFFNSLGVANLAAWKIAVGQDAASFEGNPQYLDPTNATPDLHLSAVIATPAEGSGFSVGVTDDFDGQTRASFTPVDIGADAGNFTPLPLCSGTPTTATVNGVAAVCSNTGTTLSLSVVYTDIGITYQWKSSITPGGPYTNLGTGTTQATGPLTVPTYYVCDVLCTNSGLTMTTVEKTVSINALPTVLVNGVAAATGNSCFGGSGVVLNASGASTYAWSPATGLSAITGTPVTATPGSSTIYTVTGTDGNGCVNTATANISVPAPYFVSNATATPSTICNGTNSQLNVTAANTTTYTVASATFGLLSGTGTTAVTGDDAVGAAITLPFGFNFFGTSYTTVFPYSNGWLQFGTSSASTGSYSATIPTAGAPEAFIAGLKDDLNVTGGGTCTYFTVGTAPNRVFVVYWNGVKFYNTAANNGNASFQIQMFESDMHIEVHVADATDPVASAKTIGIENATGTLGFSPAGRNNVTFSVAPGTPEAWTFTPSGVVGGLTFDWSLNPTFLSATNIANPVATAVTSSQLYSVTVSDGNCPYTKTVNVNVGAAFTAVTVTPPAPAFCTGGSVTLTATPTGGTPPYSYQWFDPSSAPAGTNQTQAANLPGVWTVNVTDNCGAPINGTASPNVVENPLPTPTITPAGSVNFCVSGTLTSSAATGNVWSPGGATTQSITASADGSYTVSVTDGNGCVGTSPATVVTISAQPSPVTVVPPAPAICAGGSVVLNAVGGTVSGTVTQTSGTISVAIPDVNATGINNAFTVSGVPGGATIDSVIVTMSITHSFVQDLIVNLEAPNGQIINLAGGVAGATGSAYTGTRITSNDAFPALLGATTGHAGTYRADKRTTAFQLTPATPPTTALWSALYSVPNGTWRLRVIDDESIGTGTLTNWQIKVVYSAPTVYTWTPPASGLDIYSGTTVTASPGATQAYTVTSTNGACSSPANVTVTVQPAPNAGTNGTLNVCSTSTTASLFAQLGGTPDGGGAWSGPSAVIGNNYDATTMTPGVYTYTVTAVAPCTVNATATVTVTEQAAPIAGSNGTLLICSNAAPVALSASLGGSPDGGGTWTDPSNAPHSATFTPGTDPAGVYTYTVNAIAPCTGAVSATVTVTYNTTDTDGDGIIDCIDNCPSYPGQIGDYCNVNYPGSPFLFGQINGSCQCVAVPCTETVTMELRTDALSSQASWQILLQGTNQVVCQFSVPIDGITSPITDNCCLPVGCYRLRVSDSGGDGFVSGGITGGYQLRESGPTGRRIIDNFGNFTSGASSAIASTYDNGAFCVPVGSDRVIYSSCDKLDWVANKYIVATENAAVTGQFNVTNTTSGYVFWFFDPNGSYSYRRFRNHATSDGFGTGATRACHFRVNGWTNTPTTPHLPSNVLLNVRIRGRVADVNLPFGPACLFKIDAARAACPLVKLQDNPLDNDYSCGVSRYFGGANTSGNRIIANPPQPVPTVSSANVRYQFRFRNGEYPNPDGCIVRPPQTSAQLNLNWSAATGTQLKCNTQYDVDVRVSLDGGVTWCVGNPSSAPALNCADPGDPSTAWGKVCSVNITTSTNCPGPLQGGSSSIGAQQGGNLTMYPNPNRGEQLFIFLTEVGADVNTVTVDIYDMTGKRVTARTIAVQDGFVKTNIDLNGDLAGGLYVVNVTAGDKTYTERLVIQP